MRPMHITSYVHSRRSYLDRQSRQVKDFSVFDFDYVPEEPLMRDEAKRLIDEFIRFEITGIPTHYAVIGGRGSGKTLTLKYLGHQMPTLAKLEVRYANCRHHNTSFKILAHFLGVEARGASLSELFERFERGCAKKTVVVLDEVDLMSPKDKRREILYLLSRSQRPFMVVMLSNSPQVLKELDPATRSSLQPMPLHFRNYDAEQIRQIIQDRAVRGLHQWQEAELAQIAALTTRKTNADARVAIKTLYYSVTQPDLGLAECFEQARKDVMIDMINDLSDATLSILWSVVSSREPLAKEIYQRYVAFCRSRAEKPFSYVYFYSNLSYLQSLGLVALVYTKVDRAYTNRVMLTFDQAVLEQICALRFGH